MAFQSQGERLWAMSLIRLESDLVPQIASTLFYPYTHTFKQPRRAGLVFSGDIASDKDDDDSDLFEGL